METPLPFSVEKTLLPAPSASFRTLGLERVGPKLAEIAPTPNARRVFLFTKITAYAGPLVFIGIFILMHFRARSANADSMFASKWIWFMAAAVLLADFAATPLFLRFTRKAMLPEPTRIDLANGILTLPAVTKGSLAALFSAAPAASKEVRICDVAALQICTGMSEGEHSYKVFQLNLVLSNPPGERLPLISHAKEADLREDARALAKMLSVSLLDHSADDPSPPKSFWKTGR